MKGIEVRGIGIELKSGKSCAYEVETPEGLQLDSRVKAKGVVADRGDGIGLECQRQKGREGRGVGDATRFRWLRPVSASRGY